MRPEEAKEYTEALSQVAGGAWRQIALGIQLKVPQDMGLSRHEWLAALGDAAKFSLRDPEERKDAALELKAQGMNNREIADVLGASEPTIRRDLDSSNDETEPELGIADQLDSSNDETDEKAAAADETKTRLDVSREAEPHADAKD